MAGDQIEVVITCLKDMFSGCITLLQAQLADVVRHIQKMQFMGYPSCFTYSAQPLPLPQSICRKIQDHRKTLTQQGNDMGFHGSAQVFRTADIIVQCLDLTWIEVPQPMILTDKNGHGLRRKLFGQR